MKRRLISIILVLAMVLSLATIAGAQPLYAGVQEIVDETELAETAETSPEENLLEEEILLEESNGDPEEIALEAGEFEANPEEALETEAASGESGENALKAKETTEEAKISLSDAGTTITKVEMSTVLNIPDMITPGADVEAIEDNKTVVGIPAK